LLFITADDYGASTVYSEEILDLISKNNINSVSVIVNLENFEVLAEKLYLHINTIKINCHLNIVEGKPILFRTGSLLVNDKGYFHRDIISLARFYTFSSRKKRLRILTEIRDEFQAQLGLFTSKFPSQAFSLDSHQHVHLLPFIHPIVDELGNRFTSSSIRLGQSVSSLSNINLAFLFRKTVFNYLAWRARGHGSMPLRSKFVLGVNEMNHWSKTMFIRIQEMVLSDPHNDYELISHPAWKNSEEISILDPQTRFNDHYTSPSRQIENSLIREHNFNDFLK
jgi:predicted glycoside hydrolase/deacetylase ChbG (UPF0249 family)